MMSSLVVADSVEAVTPEENEPDRSLWALAWCYWIRTAHKDAVSRAFSYLSDCGEPGNATPSPEVKEAKRKAF